MTSGQTIETAVWTWIAGKFWMVLTAAAILAIGWYVSKLIHALVLRITRASRFDEAVARFLSTVAQYGFFSAAIVAAMNATSIDATGFVALLGTAGVAIGLAVQGDLSNFASGVMIMVYRHFGIGDVVTAGGQTGQVDDVGLFATVMSTPNGQKIIVPNSKITSDTVINLSVGGRRCGRIDVGVAYGSDIKAVVEILRSATTRCPHVLPDTEPHIAFVNLGASSLDFAIHCYSLTDDFLDMLHGVRTNVYDDLNAAGIEIPFSQLVVHTAPAEG